MLWQQIVRKCSIGVVSLKTNSLPQQIDSVDQLLMLIKMVKRSELIIDRKLLITVFFLLFIFNSNQKWKLFVLSAKCVMEELDNAWYFSEIIDRKSPAQFSETSIIDPRLHHEVTLVVIGSKPNTPYKHVSKTLKERFELFANWIKFNY